MAFSSTLSSLQWAASGGNLGNVAAVGTITFSISRPAFDITPIGTRTALYISGISNATASLDVFFDMDDASHKAWLDHINNGSVASQWNFILETGETIAGDAFVTSMEITAQANSVGRATLQLQFTKAASSTADAWTVTTSA
jgi:hypothetical protein